MQPSTVQHDPKVIHFNAQNLADLFAFETVHLAQSESTRGALRQRRETVVKHFPEVVALDQLRRRYMPFIWRVIVVPMTLPGPGFIKELAVLRAFVRFFAERSFPSGTPKVIDDLMFENPDQPGALRSTSLEFFVSFQRCEKSFLHGVFGGSIVAQSENRVLEKVVAMVVEPTTRVGRFIGELTLWHV